MLPGVEIEAIFKEKKRLLWLGKRHNWVLLTYCLKTVTLVMHCFQCIVLFGREIFLVRLKFIQTYSNAFLFYGCARTWKRVESYQSFKIL